MKYSKEIVMKALTITKNDAGQRIDKFLQKYLKSMPLSLIYKYIRKKRVKVNGKKTENNYMLAENDHLELYINDEFFEPTIEAPAVAPSAKPAKVNLEVVFEDDNVLVVNKPVGLSSHPDEKMTTGTLIDLVKLYLSQDAQIQASYTFSPALCNRLDRNTGGLVIAAKNAAALRILNEKIKLKQVRKFYICVAKGIFEQKQALLTAFITKDEQNNQVKVDTQHGDKEIITRYQVLSEHDGNSTVEVELITGRSHQIRAHFASLGHPLIGDPKYGDLALNKAQFKHHQMLFAYKLKFDFTTDAGALNYLNQKEILIKPFS
ncbi:MAG: RluA family pseudouridine synthase [Hyphomonadaceae bacterium]|nr:RluA family pseudouridine synthase [Clostridia bacterium]